MKRTLIAILICAALAAAGFGIARLFNGGGKLRDGEHKVVICATTDVHGAYFDSTYNGQRNRTSLANVAGYVRQLRESGVKPVLIDVGDLLQGDLAAYYYNYVNTKDEHAAISIAKYLDYDALVVGNHDIEAGHSNYDRMLKAFPKKYLAANAAANAGPKKGRCYFNTYRVVRRDGVKIGILGMTNANIPNWLSEDKWSGMEFFVISNMVEFALEDMYRRENPDIVVLAVHSGTGNGFPEVENEAAFLAAEIPGIDIVLCGHDHKAVAMMVDCADRQVLLMNEGKKAVVLGQAEVTLNVKDGKVVSRKITNRLIPMEDVAPDEEYDKRFSKQFREVKEYANRVIGTITGEMDFRQALYGPSEYINLVQTVQLEASGADISFTAPLSDRGKISAGDITFQNLVDIYKYENQLYVVKMTGQQIKDYLEYSYNNWINGVGPAFNYDSADGIIYEVSKRAPKGSRVNIISMRDGSPFDLDKTYTVAMTSYRASGGGDLLKKGAGINPRDLEIVRKYDDIRNILKDYIEEHKVIEPVIPDNWKFID
ncbi:MAG: bifunctional metallophosphatase/5'-nucleotidase [Bacteroidales bacterium]|nr:bifunctional metallophosphatase/5'-nucleotidase [Bacteroidales bacterium]